MRKNKSHSALLPDTAFNGLPHLPLAGKDIESVKIFKKLVTASVALAELKGIANTLPNPQMLLNTVILKEARASSEIENVVTTQDKLYQALNAGGVEPDHATKEVLRYREAMLYGFDLIRKKGFLNTNGIINIQKVLEGNQAGIRKMPGTALRSASTGRVIYTPPDNYERIMQLMKNLEEFLNREDDVPPLIKMAVQHYQFESIHPFYDGNGRTGRIINILYLVLKNQLDSPILYLSSFIIDNKTDYYRLLQEVRTNGKLQEWILFILDGIEVTARDTIKQITAIKKLFTKTQEKVKKAAPKFYDKDLLELLFEQPYCKSEYLVQRLNISRITAAKYLKEYERIGVLKTRQVWKEKLYINSALFELLKK